MYPQNKDEADKFAAGLLRSLHSDSTRGNTMKILTDSNAPVHVRLAQVAVNIMTAMIDRIKKQSGRKPHLNLLINSVKMLLVEEARMAMIAGVKTTQVDLKNAAQLVGDMLDSGMGADGGQGMQPNTRPATQPGVMSQHTQGLVGGAMQ